MVNVGTVVDHTFTETHALRKTRSANPAETKPLSSCLQKKFTWVSKTRHIWRHGWKWRICLHDRRWQAAKLQSQENRWKWWTTPAHQSIAWTNAPSGSYTNERFHEPPSAEFSPTDHPHFYLFWQLLRPKYSLTPTAHGQPCMSSEIFRKPPARGFNTATKLVRAQDHQPSQIWRDRSPVPRQRRFRNSILWNRQSKRVIMFLKDPSMSEMMSRWSWSA